MVVRAITISDGPEIANGNYILSGKLCNDSAFFVQVNDNDDGFNTMFSLMMLSALDGAYASRHRLLKNACWLARLRITRKHVARNNLYLNPNP